MSDWFTKVHTNAWAAMVVLLLMFAGSMWTVRLVLSDVWMLGCSAQVVLMFSLGLMATCIAAIAWVVKTFATTAGNGKADKEQ